MSSEVVSYSARYILLEGNGAAVREKEMESISVGDLISIPIEEIHQIRNTGKSAVRILYDPQIVILSLVTLVHLERKQLLH